MGQKSHPSGQGFDRVGVRPDTTQRYKDAFRRCRHTRDLPELFTLWLPLDTFKRQLIMVKPSSVYSCLQDAIPPLTEVRSFLAEDL